MKKLITLVASLAVCAGFALYAQNDSRQAGIYSVMNGESTLLPFFKGINSNAGTTVLGVEVGKKKSTYNGATSGVLSDGHFVIVIDPEKKVMKMTMKSYEPFIRNFTPDNIAIVQLQVKGNKRIYDEGISLNGFNTERKDRIEFTWEQISDNSFSVVTEGLPTGEYAVVIRPTGLSPLDFSCVFGFTVEAPAEE